MRKDNPKASGDDYQIPDYCHLMYKRSTDLDMKWFYEIKDVDRRISYPFVKQSSIVCDIGGARGIDSFAFAEKGALVVNIDINSLALKEGKDFAHKCGLGVRLSFIKASATHLPLKKDIADLITCFSTLDHLPNKESANDAISEFSRVVRKYGHVAITVPNQLFLIGNLIMKIKDLTDQDAFFEQRFTPKELFKVLSASGLKPVVFDSEFPRSVGIGLLIYNFPKIFRTMPGIMNILSFAAMIFRKFGQASYAKLFGARMGYLSVKSQD